MGLTNVLLLVSVDFVFLPFFLVNLPFGLCVFFLNLKWDGPVSPLLFWGLCIFPHYFTLINYIYLKKIKNEIVVG